MSVECIKKKLELEERETLTKNLEKSETKLDSGEITASKKFVAKEREERNRQTAVAEDLKRRVFVGHKGTLEEKQIHQRLMESMPKVEEALHSKLGDEFIGASIFGSQYKGSASEDSDVDIGIFVKHKDSSQIKTLQKLVKDVFADANFVGEVHIGYYEGLDEVKRHINMVNKAADGKIKQVTTMTYEEGRLVYHYDILETTAEHVLSFFDGEFFGKGIGEARKELIAELAKRPSGEGELIWEKVRELIGEHERSWKYGGMISDDELEEIIKVRKDEFPSFQEIKRNLLDQK
jgi:predicted nucleotidyltransferase